ncbi:MAG: DNA repair exonuclease [Actinomycetia bacterium]|nr:DNA repair exonuclease [Actinomycetes bacterium]
MTVPVRFIHAADLHLDAPFGAIDAQDRRVRDALAASTYEALDAIVATCIDNQVDFLVLSGDVFNARERGVRSQFAFARAAATLERAGIPIYMVHGNHDPATGTGGVVRIPDNVHVFPHDRVERVVFERDGEAVCALYGRSFRVAAETADLASEFRRDPADTIAIGVLHTNVGARPDYDDYAPSSPQDLISARMDYWALGHIHKPEVVLTRPLAVYAGCPQGLDPTQTGLRGCYLVTLGDGPTTAEFIPTASVIWESATVECGELGTLEGVRAAVRSVCDAARTAADGRPVVLRVELIGRSEAHHDLALPAALKALTDEVRREAMDAEQWVWVDRVRDHTRPAIDLDALRHAEDFSGDIVRLADELLADPEAASELVAAELRALLDRVGNLVTPPDPADVVARARDLALDRLLAEDDR